MLLAKRRRFRRMSRPFFDILEAICFPLIFTTADTYRVLRIGMAIAW